MYPHIVPLASVLHLIYRLHFHCSPVAPPALTPLNSHHGYIESPHRITFSTSVAIPVEAPLLLLCIPFAASLHTPLHFHCPPPTSPHRSHLAVLVSPRGTGKAALSNLPLHPAVTAAFAPISPRFHPSCVPPIPPGIPPRGAASPPLRCAPRSRTDAGGGRSGGTAFLRPALPLRPGTARIGTVRGGGAGCGADGGSDRSGGEVSRAGAVPPSASPQSQLWYRWGWADDREQRRNPRKTLKYIFKDLNNLPLILPPPTINHLVARALEQGDL